MSFQSCVLRELITAQLRGRGLITHAGIVRLTALTESFRLYWGSFLQGEQFFPFGGTPQSLLRSLGKALNRTDSSHHPLLWLSLAAFLFVDWDQFLTRYELHRTSGRTQRKSIASTFEVKADPRIEKLGDLMKEGASIAEASRDLGVAQSVIRRWCVRHNFAKDRVLANVDAGIQAEALRLYLEGSPQEEIAAQLDIDVTLVRYALDAVPGAILHRRASSNASLRQRHRLSLRSSRIQHPALGRAQLRLKCQAAYSWLLNHDRQWLESELPEGGKQKTIDRKPDGPQFSLSF